MRDVVKGSEPSSDATPAFMPAIVEDEPLSPAAPALPAEVAIGAAGADPAPLEIARRQSHSGWSLMALR